jgi:predicted nucleic acid-binding protein
VSVLVDTSVWSVALRRDRPASSRELEALRAAVERGEVCLLGVVLQEVLQGFPSLDRSRRLLEHLAPFPLLSLHRGDYVYAAEIRNRCRYKGLAISTIDAQIAAAAINHHCALLTLDEDFRGVARHFPLRFA